MANDLQLTNAAAVPGTKVPSSGIFPWPRETDIVPTKGYGMDLDGGTDRNVAENWRYQTCYIFLAYAAGAWTLPANFILPMWQAGQLDAVQIVPAPPAAMTWAQSRSETDLYKGGAPVPRDNCFRIRALSFALGRPFVAPGAGAGQVHVPNMGFYEAMIQAALADILGVQFQFQDQACAYEAGLSQFHAMAAGKTGNGQPVRNGAGFGLANLQPLRGSVYAGARDESDQLTINVTGPTVPVTFNENPATAIGANIYVPITLQAYGQPYPICPPAICATPQVTTDQLRGLIAGVIQDMGRNRQIPG